MNRFTHTLLSLLLLMGFASTLRAQSLVEDANPASEIATPAGTFSETIKIISNSKKIFILTNTNQQLNPGDFISLALNDNLAARAVVAKTHQGQVGIKILKIYSLTQWGKLRRDLEVQIIKGDDSSFGKVVAKTEEQPTTESKIKTEDDLYTNDVVVEDEVEMLEENTNRHIKPDNLVSISGSYFTANLPSSIGGSERATELGLGWAYQFRDNFFLEGFYGRAQLQNYPNNGLSTLVNRLAARIKYNIKGPAYTFIMPYAGFQSFSVSSPDAGQVSSAGTLVAEEENQAIEDIRNKTGLIFGVTLMRRLVPGWFLKGDIGSDLINLGFAVEF